MLWASLLDYKSTLFYKRQSWSNSIEQHNSWSVFPSSLHFLEQSDWFQWCHFHLRQMLIGSHFVPFFAAISLPSFFCHFFFCPRLLVREVRFPVLFVVEDARCLFYLPTPLYSSWKPFWFSSGKSGLFFLVLSEISITSSRRKRVTTWKKSSFKCRLIQKLLL